MKTELITVLLESPYGSKEKDPQKYKKIIARNVFYAQLCMRDCLMLGEAPFAAHLLYTQENILRDYIPEERKLGIEAGFIWGIFAKYSVFYIDLGMTPGMIEGQKRADQENRSYVIRSLPDDLKKIFNKKFPKNKII